MTKKNHSEMWRECLQIIRDNIPDEHYQMWFKNIESLGFDGNELHLQVPSRYFVEMLEVKFGRVLVHALKRVYGAHFELVYEFSEVKACPDTKVTQKSERPSQAILEAERQQAANPFKAVDNQPFDTQLNPKYNFENYCEGDSNRVARSIALSLAENPRNLTFNPLFVYGSTGVGKTHLIQAIGIRIKENNPQARVLYVTSRLFESQYTAAVTSKKTNDFFRFYQSVDTLIIDDIQDLHGKVATQNTFFHIFNHLHQNNKHIILSSDCAPAHMDGMETRLLSRFRWGMAVELDKPDLGLRRDVLVLKARQNGLDLPTDVIDYVAEHVSDSIRELEGILVSLVGMATVMGRDINLDLAQEVVGRAVKVERKVVNFELIAEEVCSYYQLDPDLLFSKLRRRDISDARQLIMYLSRKLAKMPLVSIGSKLDRTHATVKHGIQIVEERLDFDKQLRQDLSRIEANIIG